MSVRNRKKTVRPPNIFTTGSLLAMGFWGLVGDPDRTHFIPINFLTRSPEIQQHPKNSDHAHKVNDKYVLAHIITCSFTKNSLKAATKHHKTAVMPRLTHSDRWMNAVFVWYCRESTAALLDLTASNCVNGNMFRARGFHVPTSGAIIDWPMMSPLNEHLNVE